jgi:hypothetical protein
MDHAPVAPSFVDSRSQAAPCTARHAFTRRRAWAKLGFGVTGLVALLTFALAAAPPASAQSADASSLPKGGKTLLLQVLGTPTNTAELKRIATATHSADEWSKLLPARSAKLSKKQRRTLAEYLALNMPMEAGALQQALKPKGAAVALPPDGREVTWKFCQSECHSVLMVQIKTRSVEEWLACVEAKYHGYIRGKMDARQIQSFVRYAAINMPAK